MPVSQKQNREREITARPVFIELVNILAGILTLFGSTKPSTEELDQALMLYRQNQLIEALPRFEQAVVKNQNNPADQVLYLFASVIRLISKRVSDRKLSDHDTERIPDINDGGSHERLYA